MKILEIKGLEGTSDKINANPFEKRIEILGGNFISQDLEKLSEWIDEYLEKEKRITLKFLDDPNRPDVLGTSFRHLDYVNFPDLKSKWNEKVEDLFNAQPGNRKQFRSILSKFKEFSFIIEKDDDHPELIANYDTGEIEINGRILSENTYLYFLPLLAWIDNYLEDSNHKITFNTKFEFIGDEAVEIIINFLEMIKSKSETSQIVWGYADDDESMKEEGYKYKDICKLGYRMKFASFHMD